MRSLTWGENGCGSPERFVFVEMRCQKRQDFLRAQHNMSPSLIISHSQTWSALNALMLKEPHRLEASSRWNHSTHPWQTAIHHTRIKQSLHIKSLPKKAEIIYALKYIQQNFNLSFLIPTFWTILSYLPTLKYSRKEEKLLNWKSQDVNLEICHIY